MPGRDFFFTMDAGPNIHLISERKIRDDLNEILEGLSIEAEIWEDESGTGPKFV
jgi:mevalonate pyrophosphate decarboxylase